MYALPATGVWLRNEGDAMRRMSVCLAAVGMLLCSASLAVAQEEKKEPVKQFVYGTYFVCDVNEQWRVDEVMETVVAPVYDAAVQDGTITAWGWLAHDTGGRWRRVLYYAAPTIDALLDAGETLQDRVGEKNRMAQREIGRICNAHDDYIWRQVVGTSAEKRGGEAGFSVYFDCDITREDRADEIVEKVLAPVYDRYVQEGSLTSWGWLTHVVGGEWRRLATMRGKDHKSVLAARAKILEEIGEKHDKEGNEFSSICGSHQDYMWDIELETP